MALVRIEALKLGMTLARDVKNSQGQLLLRAGMVIQERHLMLLTSWGVPEVDTEEIGSVGPGALSGQEDQRTRRLNEVKEALQEKFRQNNLQFPVMAELFDLCARRKAKMLK